MSKDLKSQFPIEDGGFVLVNKYGEVMHAGWVTFVGDVAYTLTGKASSVNNQLVWVKREGLNHEETVPAIKLGLLFVPKVAGEVQMTHDQARLVGFKTQEQLSKSLQEFCDHNPGGNFRIARCGRAGVDAIQVEVGDGWLCIHDDADD